MLPAEFPDINDELLAASDDEVLRDRARWVTPSHQSSLRLLEHDGRLYIIKAPLGHWPMRWITRRLLRHEYRVYRLLEGMAGVPRCYGLVKNRYLVLEHVDGQAYRHAAISDREKYFARLLEIIRQLHARGIGHGDLKNKDNLLVVNGAEPYILDFGIAIVSKRGFRPLNRYLFRLAQRLDLNAWVKHKYQRRIENISEADRQYWTRSPMEKAWNRMRNVVQWLRGRSSSAAYRPPKAK